MKILAISILIQMPLADACSELIIRTWQPFQIKQELVLQFRKCRVIKRGKAVTCKSSKVRDVGTSRLQEAQRNGTDVQSLYGSELSACVWGGCLRRTGASPALLKSGMQVETLLRSDSFRNTMVRDDLPMNPSGGAPATIKEEYGTHYIRLYLFKHDMKDLNRDAAERHASGDSLWETFLSLSSGKRNQSVLETMGKIFEPKVDFGIEF
ncbi:MAG: hypothetical protein V1766_07445 [Pseudomonadota bacterium]